MADLEQRRTALHRRHLEQRRADLLATRSRILTRINQAPDTVDPDLLGEHLDALAAYWDEINGALAEFDRPPQAVAG